MRAVLLVLCASLVGPATARAAPPGAPVIAPKGAAQEAVIDKVVVFSDQARVHRTARVTVGAGPTRTILASLPAAVRPDTVRVECESAAIAHVEVTRTWERLPRQVEARALLARIEALLDELRGLDDESRHLHAELRLVESLQPVAQRPKPDKEPPLIFVDAWRRVIQWAEGRATRARQRLAVLPAQRSKLTQRLEALRVAGRKLLPDAETGPALRVAVTLRGAPGAHRVGLSYVVDGVRWVPSYDLRYDPLNPAVAASYYALVTQSSGEDWRGARLAFSTIMPSHLLAVPELPTWTFGRTTTFTPTPRLRWEPRPANWVPPAVTPRPDPVMGELGRALRRGPALPAAGETARDADGKDDADDRGVGADKAKEEAEPPRPPAEPSRYAPAPAQAPRPAPRPRAQKKYDFEADEVSGDLLKPSAPARRTVAESVAVAGGRHRVRVQSTPTETVPWTDAGYRPPELDPDLPAASAQGHRFTMDAPGRHTVAANGTAVRVPLGRERFGVTPVYRIVPGRSKAAYLTAEIFNSSGRPVLRGHANLFTGATYSGQTKLETAVPGGKLLLPLGVDEGVKVNRMINQRTVATGVVFKDEVSEYTVTIEIANHRRHAIRVEVEDQVPVKANADARVEGFEATPAMVGPELDGKVTYKGTVGAGRVQKLVFKFRLVRPKNWELRQHDG